MPLHGYCSNCTNILCTLNQSQIFICPCAILLAETRAKLMEKLLDLKITKPLPVGLKSNLVANVSFSNQTKMLKGEKKK